MAADTQQHTCDLCGKQAEPAFEECIAVTCIARCSHPKDEDVYHFECLKKYMRSFARNIDVSSLSGYVCPKGKGRGTSHARPCPSKVSHSQRIIIKSNKPSATASQDAASSASDTSSTKPKKGKKGGGAGQTAAATSAATAAAPKASKTKLPALNNLPSRGPAYIGAPEPYLPTEYVKQAPVPEKPRKDPLGRNAAAAAAAAASSAKAAKKNAKRAAARQRKQEQEQGPPDGTAAAQAAAETASDAASFSESDSDNEEEWEERVEQGQEQQEEWPGAGGAEHAAWGDSSSPGRGDEVGDVFEQAWHQPHRLESDMSAATWVTGEEFSSSPLVSHSCSPITAGGAFSAHAARQEPAAAPAPEANVGSAFSKVPLAVPAASGHVQEEAGGLNSMGISQAAAPPMVPVAVPAAEPMAAVASYLSYQQHTSQPSSLSAVAAALQQPSSSALTSQPAFWGSSQAARTSSTQQPAWPPGTSSFAAAAAAPYQPMPVAAPVYQAPTTAMQQQQLGYGATYSSTGTSSAVRVHPYALNPVAQQTLPVYSQSAPYPGAASWAPQQQVLQQQQQYTAAYAPAAGTGLQGYQAAPVPTAAGAAYPAAYPAGGAAVGAVPAPQQQYPGYVPAHVATGGVGATAAVGLGQPGPAQDDEDGLGDLLLLLGVHG